MSDINDLRSSVIKFRDDRDWSQFNSPKETAISLILEASEYLELFQWKSSDEIKKLIETDKETISDELADILYWVLLISYDMDIDLNDALRKKLVKNASKYPVDKSKGKHTKYTKL